MVIETKEEERELQKLKDTLIECIHAGDFGELYQQAGSAFELICVEKNLLDEHIKKCGVWLDFSKIPFEIDISDGLLSGEVTDERLRMIESGDAPTRGELIKYLWIWIDNALKTPDFEILPAYGVHEFRHSDNRICFFVSIGTGCSLTLIKPTIEKRIVGYFQTFGDAMSWLRGKEIITDDLNDEAYLNQVLERVVDQRAYKRITFEDITGAEWREIAREDFVIDNLLKKKIPLTRTHYLDLAFKGYVPEGDDWGAESEAEVLWPFQHGVFDDQRRVHALFRLVDQEG